MHYIAKLIKQRKHAGQNGKVKTYFISKRSQTTTDKKKASTNHWHYFSGFGHLMLFRELVLKPFLQIFAGTAHFYKKN